MPQTTRLLLVMMFESSGLHNAAAVCAIFQRNPSILLCGLSWGYPGWLSHKWWDPYDMPNRTADYIARWVAGAKNVYNLDIDYVGVSVFARLTDL